MEHVVAIWKDEKNGLGIIEVKDQVFGSSFHPVCYQKESEGKYSIINGLWYTTYHGARQYFRAKTNPYSGYGRMRKIQ
ncbi:hypothetical protein GLW04_01975 [Halobacillus litoralis]|uniref:Uncharacterized protein n=1 Tax=Halobacillus litoralis TaxID=45668 RepID=A0A845DX47_9BACI|nr:MULTISPECIES: hypothetical protein [Halobacillus]MCA1023821.1 hypothetical protein [Halobacillus litoralis]MYL18637.1 hypothetical protein [Halobacillus litoralis]MYL31615.1 hypothetical protein [Halobacillus halophilus]MYL39080.1 hypothetical protein [Halobacillus litoralis]